MEPLEGNEQTANSSPDPDTASVPQGSDPHSPSPSLNQTPPAINGTSSSSSSSSSSQRSPSKPQSPPLAQSAVEMEATTAEERTISDDREPPKSNGTTAAVGVEARSMKGVALTHRVVLSRNPSKKDLTEKAVVQVDAVPLSAVTKVSV